MNKIVKVLALIAIGGVGVYFVHYKKSSSFSKEKVIYTEYSRAVLGFDPILIEDNQSIHECSKVYEGLLEYHYLKKPVEIIPNLAESLPEISEDGRVYTFKVKKGVYFHDNKCFPKGKGRELKSTDFIYSIKRFAAPQNRAPLYSKIEGKILGLAEWREANRDSASPNYDTEIEGLEYIDDYTFSIKLTNPDPLFIYNFCIWIFYAVPREAVEYYGENFTNNPVGTGPFIIEEFSLQSNKIVAVRNKNFREKYYPSDASEHLQHLLGPAGKKIPFVDKVVAYIILEEQTKYLKFKKKELDIIDLYGSADINEIINEGELIDESLLKIDAKLSIRQMSNTDVYGVNCQDDTMKNVKLRQAISLAYDREGENNLLNGGMFTIAHGIIPPTMLGYDPDNLHMYTKYNLEEAKNLLAEAGYPEGRGLGSITLDIRQGAQQFREAEYFKKCMEKIGIDIEIRVNSWPELVNKIKNKNCQIFKMQWFADYPNAENFLELFVSNRTGIYTNYNNPVYDTLYNRVIQIPLSEQDEIEEIYKELNKIFANDLPAIPKIHVTQIFLYQNEILNFEPWDVKMNIYEYLDKK